MKKEEKKKWKRRKKKKSDRKKSGLCQIGGGKMALHNIETRSTDTKGYWSIRLGRTLDVGLLRLEKKKVSQHMYHKTKAVLNILTQMYNILKQI